MSTVVREGVKGLSEVLLWGLIDIIIIIIIIISSSSSSSVIIIIIIINNIIVDFGALLTMVSMVGNDDWVTMVC